MLVAIFSADSSDDAIVSCMEIHLLNITITWCFIAFVVAPEIELTEKMDYIFRFSLLPSTFLIIESPRIRVFFTTLFFNFSLPFSPFFSLSLLFSFTKSEELALWCSFSVEILGLLIFSLFADDISDSLFGFSFAKLPALQLDFFQ